MMADADTNARQATFHESNVLLAVKIAVLQLMLALGSVVLILTCFYFISPVADTNLLAVLIVLITIVAHAIGAVTLVYTLIRWQNTTFSISPDQIIVRTGRAGEKTKIYNTRDLEEIEVDQSPLGKSLDYGTLSFRAPGLDDRVELPNIPRPWHYADMIRQATQRPSFAV
ncbi:MAG: Bacterial domain [Candidatus Saccharibacteria bacterium]|nr:Bacterial domain [Candidatus Saccharibacteria bacterium]